MAVSALLPGSEEFETLVGQMKQVASNAIAKAVSDARNGTELRFLRLSGPYTAVDVLVIVLDFQTRPERQKSWIVRC